MHMRFCFEKRRGEKGGGLRISLLFAGSSDWERRGGGKTVGDLVGDLKAELEFKVGIIFSPEISMK